MSLLASLATLLLSTLAGYPSDEPALVPSPAGATALSRALTVETLTLASEALGETRTVHLVLPPSFARTSPGRRYPVAVVLDGEENVPPAAAVAAELARNAQVPELVLVAIPNPASADWRLRVRDLTPPGLSVSGSSRSEGGDRFLDFIEEELLPAVERQYRGGGPRVLIGHSSGGILATWAAATRPGFRAVIAIDTPTHLDDEWLPRRLLERAAGEAPGDLRYASYEARFGWRDGRWEELRAAAPPAWKLHREELASETHESLGMLAMYLGLREVFADYAQRSAPVAPTTSTLPYYERLATELGAALVPPQRVLRNVVEDLVMEGRGAHAREAYLALAAGYGVPADSAELLAEIAEVERRPPPAETVESLLAMPIATPEEARAYVGEWVGDSWLDEGEPRAERERLRLAVVGGKLVGETITSLPGGEELSMPWTHLRVTPVGLTWGYLNGMRPRGVLLHETQLTGDTLTGTCRMAGVDFRRPDGSRPPVLSLEFRRVKP